MGLHNSKSLFDGLICGGLIYGGAYTRGNNKISNFNFSCNVILLQIIIFAQQLMVSPDQSKGQIRRFHRFHLHLHPHPSILFVEAIALQGDTSFRKLFVKNGFCETSDGYFIN